MREEEGRGSSLLYASVFEGVQVHSGSGPIKMNFCPNFIAMSMPPLSVPTKRQFSASAGSEAPAGSDAEDSAEFRSFC